MQTERTVEFVNKHFSNESGTTPVYGFNSAGLNHETAVRATHNSTEWTEGEDRALRENYHAAEVEKWPRVKERVSHPRCDVVS